MKDTMAPGGLVPTLMAFEALFSLPLMATTYPMQAERMDALRTAREEMASLVAASRIAQALSSKLPPAARYRRDPDGHVNVSVFRKRTGRW